VRSCGNSAIEPFDILKHASGAHPDPVPHETRLHEELTFVPELPRRAVEPDERFVLERLRVRSRELRERSNGFLLAVNDPARIDTEVTAEFTDVIPVRPH
jgi:hypothetical protein